MDNVRDGAPDIAIFDLDYTLTKRGTWGRFVWSCVRARPHLWLPLYLSTAWTQLGYMRGKRPRNDVKLAMMRWSMVGLSRDDLQARADAFAKREVAQGLRPGGIKTLQNHQDKGDIIIMASAAVDIIATAIGRELNISHVLATEMDWDNCNILKPLFKSQNCYGPEKLIRFKSYLNAHSGLKHSNTIITMYSDSYSDLEILNYADIGVAVNPDRRLRVYAKTHDIRVVDWTQPDGA